VEDCYALPSTGREENSITTTGENAASINTYLVLVLQRRERRKKAGRTACQQQALRFTLLRL